MDQPQVAQIKPAKKTVQRSPNYPAFALDEAVKKTKILWEKDGRAGTPRDVAIKHLNYSPKSGPAYRALGTLKSFGLTTEKDERIFLTKEALDIVIYPSTDVRHKEALRLCALKPKIYNDLTLKYVAGFPSDETLAAELIGEFKFNPKSAHGVISDFRETLRYADIMENDALSTGDFAGRDDDENQNSSAREVMDLTAQQQRTQRIMKFDWSLAPGTTAHLNIIGEPSDEDWEFLKICLNRAIKQLSEKGKGDI